LTINRIWQSGDTVEFTLPAEIRVKRYNGKDQIARKSRYSFEYEGNLQPLPGQPLHFSNPGSPQLSASCPADEQVDH
jgi:hypothetical protein